MQAHMTHAKQRTQFRIVFTINLEHHGSQDSPKTAKKAPKTAPESLQEPFKKGALFLTQFLYGNGPQNNPKNGPEIIHKTFQKRNHKIARKYIKKGPAKWDPELTGTAS
jgi:hypothetical protein